LSNYLEQFEQAIESNDVERSRELLVDAVKGFTPQCDVADLVRERNQKSADESRKDNIIQYPG
jgi:hypothetical protein